MMKLIACVLIVFNKNVYGDLSFLTLGDWGGAALTEQDSKNVYAVATQMAKTASSISPSFIVNTGDNFYWCGIQNTSDYQIGVDYVEPYSDSTLQVPWYGVLGNHEYGYNVQAQIDYASINKNWIMDDRYYTKRIELDTASSTYLSMIFLDTSPCISSYRSSAQSGWDPCSTQYPTCSLVSTDDDFEGPCEFHANILSQDCATQYSWLAAALSAVPSDDWLIIVGHHPADEVDVEDFTTLIQNHGFSLYLNGHAHTLTHYTVDNGGSYITSGAGSLVDTTDQSHEGVKAKVLGLHIGKNEIPSSKDVTVKSKGHSYQTVFNKKVAGFTSHTFNSDFTLLTNNFISYTGETIYSFTANKSGSISTL